MPSIQARRASECVHWPHHELHALAGASGLYWNVFTCRSAALVPKPRTQVAQRIRSNNSSAERRPVVSVPSNRLSAKSRFVACRSRIFSSIVPRVMKR